MRSFMQTRSRACRAALLLALAMGGAAQPLAAQEGDAASVSAAPPIAVIAHRGGALARPENTMPAFHHAAGMGAEYLEFDMMMTRDNRIAITHDTNINPEFCTSDQDGGIVAGPVRGLSFPELSTFDCGSAVRPSYAGDGFLPVEGAGIPGLDEVFASFKHGDALFFPETKIPQGSDVDPVLFATLFEDAVRRHGLEDRVILQSFDFRTIDALHAMNPRIRTCLLGAPRHTRDYLALLQQHKSTCIVLSHGAIDAAGAAQLRNAGVLLFSGVADKADDWRRYVDLGFDALFTNDPEGAIAFLRQSGLRGPSVVAAR